jgi:hypothetical protein
MLVPPRKSPLQSTAEIPAENCHLHRNYFSAAWILDICITNLGADEAHPTKAVILAVQRARSPQQVGGEMAFLHGDQAVPWLQRSQKVSGGK